ncbi:hypothetical protein ACFV0W_39360 [Streptomyces anulatus]
MGNIGAGGEKFAELLEASAGGGSIRLRLGGDAGQVVDRAGRLLAVGIGEVPAVQDQREQAGRLGTQRLGPDGCRLAITRAAGRAGGDAYGAG